jgi:hypothetical protein
VTEPQPFGCRPPIQIGVGDVAGLRCIERGRNLAAVEGGRGVGQVVHGAAAESFGRAAIATRGSERGPVTAHDGSGRDNCGIRQGLADRRSLVSAEEEQLVFLDGPADDAAKLIPLIRAGHGRKILAGAAKAVIAQELEQVAVKLVGARARDHAYGSGRAALRRLAADLGTELLNRVGKGQRHGAAGEKIQVVGAVEAVFGAEQRSAAGPANRHRAADAIDRQVAEPARLRIPRLHGSAG